MWHISVWCSSGGMDKTTTPMPMLSCKSSGEGAASVGHTAIAHLRENFVVAVQERVSAEESRQQQTPSSWPKKLFSLPEGIHWDQACSQLPLQRCTKAVYFHWGLPLATSNALLTPFKVQPLPQSTTPGEGPYA